MEQVDQEFSLKVLRCRVDAFFKKIHKLVSRVTDEAVHDARVESRRMRAALEAFREMFAPRPFDAAYRAVRQVTRILGEPRETAVSLDLIRELARTKAGEPLCLEYLQKRFASKLRKQEAKLHKGLHRINTLRLRSRLEFLLSIMEPNTEHAEVQPVVASLPNRAVRRTPHPYQTALFQMRESAIEQAHRILTSLAAPISEFRTARRFNTATDEELHALRIAAKKSRYAMEIYSSIWPGGLSDRIEKARRFQDAGGAYNDWSVLCLCFENEIKRLDSAASVRLAFQMGRLAAHTEQRKASTKVMMRAALIELQESLAGLPYAGQLKIDSNLGTRAMIPSSGNIRRRAKPRRALPHAPPGRGAA